MQSILAIATNIPQRLKTGFVVQGHLYTYNCMRCHSGIHGNVLLQFFSVN